MYWKIRFWFDDLGLKLRYNEQQLRIWFDDRRYAMVCAWYKYRDTVQEAQSCREQAEAFYAEQNRRRATQAAIGSLQQ